MTLFTNYRKRIVKRISELENEQADLAIERSKHVLYLEPKEYCSYSVKISDLKSIIDELKRLL
jgi:hypothetical protein